MHPKIRPIRDGVTFLLLARSKELRLPLFASRQLKPDHWNSEIPRTMCRIRRKRRCALVRVTEDGTTFG
jgi:hypothetical protein